MNDWTYLDQFRMKYPWQKTVSKCGQRLKKSEDIPVQRNSTTSKIHFGNTMSCGNVWLCQRCSKRICAGRREELNEVISSARDRGYQVLMMTSTVPHHKEQSFASVMHRLKYIREQTNQGGWFTRFKKSQNLIGSIKSTEITYSIENGWHPHYHELLILSNPLILESDTKEQTDLKLSNFENNIYSRWVSICEKEGFQKPSRKNGIKITYSKTGEDYITKWGLQFELTGKDFKESKNLSVHGLLSLPPIKSDFIPSSKDDLLFVDLHKKAREFVNGIKGINALTYSRYLKSIFQVGHYTDQEIIDEIQSEFTEDIDIIPAEAYQQFRRFGALAILYEAYSINFLSSSGLWRTIYQDYFKQEYQKKPDKTPIDAESINILSSLQ